MPSYQAIKDEISGEVHIIDIHTGEIVERLPPIVSKHLTKLSCWQRFLRYLRTLFG